MLLVTEEFRSFAPSYTEVRSAGAPPSPLVPRRAGVCSTKWSNGVCRASVSAEALTHIQRVWSSAHVSPLPLASPRTKTQTKYVEGAVLGVLMLQIGTTTYFLPIFDVVVTNVSTRNP